MQSLTNHIIESLLNRVVAAAKEVGLIVNASKTKCLFARTDLAALYFDCNPLENVTEFVYLGSRISSNGNIATEILNRIARATAISSRMAKFWKNKGTTRNTKNKVYNACVKSALLYAAET